MKNFNTFMYNQKLHRERKHFSPYCLQAFSVEEISEDHINDCFKIKQMIQMPKKGEYIRFKKFEREIKSSFIIYADFVSILALKDNEKQNFEESSKTIVKNMLLVDIVINQYALIISLLNVLSLTQVKMIFTFY